MDKFDKLIFGEFLDFSMEKCYVRKDGCVIWVKVMVLVMSVIRGLFLLVISVVEDIMEVRVVEQVCWDVECCFELVVVIVELGFWEWDVVNYQVYLLLMWKQQFGYEDYELLNCLKEIVFCLYFEDFLCVWDYIICYIEQLVLEFRIDYWLCYCDGSYCWFVV